MARSLPLSDFMAGDGKAFTNPGLDIKDFIGTSFTTAPDGKLYQLPDQQFANLYWFRADWFARKDLQDKFKAKYGYELGVPVNWSAYEDIADFFTQRREEHRRRAGLRPHGLRQEGPVARLALHRRVAVDGRRSRQRHPERHAGRRMGHPRRRRQMHAGGRVGDARRRSQLPGRRVRADQVHRLDEEVRAARSAGHDVLRSRARCPRRAISRSRSSGTRRSPRDMTKPGLPVVNADGTPKWRMAPSPARPVLEGRHAERLSGRGLVDVLQVARRRTQRAAAWLYAQFVTSQVGVAEEVDRRSHAHPRLGHPLRATSRRTRPKYGGLIEFYRSPARVAWTPTGTNVPDYPKLAQLWWQNVATAVTGEKTPQAAMDKLAKQMDRVMARLERAGMKNCPPKLNEKKIRRSGCANAAPWAKLANEKPKGETVAYDELLTAWKEGRAR